MNIKSLLLGSAAAAVAFTGAKAADAIVIAEPEPMEYVRICDAYGAGYFYIPGTETCLSISGWVRYQIDAVDRSARVRIDVRDSAGDSVDPFPLELRERLTLDLVSLDITERAKGWSKTVAAQVNFDARSETEYGTLRGWIQLEGEATDVIDSSDIPIAINHAVIQLGGLWLGYTDSLFTSSSEVGGSDLGNYGGFTNADTFNYHYEQRNQIGYQFNGGNGFWGGIALEHDGNEDYMPDVVGKVAFSQDWGGVWLAAAYDESADGAGVRGGVQGNFGALTARLDAYYQSNVAVSYGRNAKWALQGTAIYQVNPQFAVAGGLEYRKDLALAQAVYLPNSSAWAGQIGINWEPVQNLVIGADVTHNREKASITLSDPQQGSLHLSARQDWTAFRLRFQRNF